VAEAQPINLIVRERAKLQARVEAAKYASRTLSAGMSKVVAN